VIIWVITTSWGWVIPLHFLFFDFLSLTWAARKKVSLLDNSLFGGWRAMHSINGGWSFAPITGVLVNLRKILAPAQDKPSRRESGNGARKRLSMEDWEEEQRRCGQRREEKKFRKWCLYGPQIPIKEAKGEKNGKEAAGADFGLDIKPFQAWMGKGRAEKARLGSFFGCLSKHLKSHIH